MPTCSMVMGPPSWKNCPLSLGGGGNDVEGYLVKSWVYQVLTRAMNLGSLVLTSPSPSLGGC